MKTTIVVCGFLALCLGAFEGGSIPPLQVSVRQLIEIPEQFDGKRVSVVAYYGVEHHGPYLCADAKTAREGTTGSWRIYPDFESSPLSRKELDHVKRGYVLVVGTFKYRDMKVTKGKDFDYIVPGFGWMNIYDKEITDITYFANAPAPKR